MPSTTVRRPSPPIGVKVIAVWCLIVGLATFVLGIVAHPFYLVLSAAAFGALVGLWSGRTWGLACAFFLFLVEALRKTGEFLAGDVGSLVTVVLSLLVLGYLYAVRGHFE